jgi:hypothetical protein
MKKGNVLIIIIIVFSACFAVYSIFTLNGAIIKQKEDRYFVNNEKVSKWLNGIWQSNIKMHAGQDLYEDVYSWGKESINMNYATIGFDLTAARPYLYVYSANVRDKYYIDRIENKINENNTIEINEKYEGNDDTYEQTIIISITDKNNYRIKLSRKPGIRDLAWPEEFTWDYHKVSRNDINEQMN